MITASHNPPQDNGYKLYLGDGAQIVAAGRRGDLRLHRRRRRRSPTCRCPTTASRCSATTCSTPTSTGRSACSTTGPRAGRRRVHGDARRRRRDRARGVRRAPGSRRSTRSREQVEPDPDFPTVAFPNPEEPGALDLSLALARAGRTPTSCWPTTPTPTGSAVADPRRRRPTAAGGRSPATRSAALLADHLLRTGRLRARRRARHHRRVVAPARRSWPPTAGVAYGEALTGFKWVVRTPRPGPAVRCSATRRRSATASATLVRDKDGITAALVAAELAAALQRRGLVAGRPPRRARPRATAPTSPASGRSASTGSDWLAAGHRRPWRRCGPLRRPRWPGGRSLEVEDLRRHALPAQRRPRLDARRRPARRPPERHRAEAQVLRRGGRAGRRRRGVAPAATAQRRRRRGARRRRPSLLDRPTACRTAAMGDPRARAVLAAGRGRVPGTPTVLTLGATGHGRGEGVHDHPGRPRGADGEDPLDRRRSVTTEEESGLGRAETPAILRVSDLTRRPEVLGHGPRRPSWRGPTRARSGCTHTSTRRYRVDVPRRLRRSCWLQPSRQLRGGPFPALRRGASSRCGSNVGLARASQSIRRDPCAQAVPKRRSPASPRPGTM